MAGRLPCSHQPANDVSLALAPAGAELHRLPRDPTAVLLARRAVRDLDRRGLLGALRHKCVCVCVCLYAYTVVRPVVCWTSITLHRAGVALRPLTTSLNYYYVPQLRPLTTQPSCITRSAPAPRSASAPRCAPPRCITVMHTVLCACMPSRQVYTSTYTLTCTSACT